MVSRSENLQGSAKRSTQNQVMHDSEVSIDLSSDPSSIVLDGARIYLQYPKFDYNMSDNEMNY